MAHTRIITLNERCVQKIIGRDLDDDDNDDNLSHIEKSTLQSQLKSVSIKKKEKKSSFKLKKTTNCSLER